MQAQTSGDLLRNLGGQDGVGDTRSAYERALKACYGLSILGCVPLMVPPFYVLLLQAPSWDGTGEDASTAAGSVAGGALAKVASLGSLLPSLWGQRSSDGGGAAAAGGDVQPPSGLVRCARPCGSFAAWGGALSRRG